VPLINKQRLMGSGQVTSASAQNEGTFHPKQVSGLQQWYDASDASTLATASVVTETNHALASNGSTATQVGTNYGGVASRAIDGNTDGNWNNGSVTHTNSTTNAWWQVDFGQTRSIDKVVIWNRTDNAQDRLDGYRLDFYTGSNGAGSVVHTISESPSIPSWTSTTSTLTASVACRSIRLVNEDATQPQYLSIAEFQAFQSEVVSQYLYLTQWQDKSGNAFHLTASSTTSAPVLSANEIYTHAAVQFSGTVSSSLPVVTSSAVYGNNWYPTSIASCSLWLDADDASTISESGGAISAWTNKAPAPYAGLFDLTQSNGANQPSLIAGGQNSRSVVRFNTSVDEELNGVGSDTYQTPASSGKEITIFMVCRFSTGHSRTSQYIAGILGFALDSDYRANGADKGGIAFGDAEGSAGHYLMGDQMHWPTTNTFKKASLASPNGFTESQRVYTFRNQATAPMRINGDGSLTLKQNDSPLLGVYRSDTDHKWLTVGRAYADTSYPSNFDGDICEIICYAANLSDAETTTVETYLQNKWDITVATQSSDITSDNTDVAYPTQSVSTEAKSIVAVIKQDSASSGSVWAFKSGSNYYGTFSTDRAGNTDFAYGSNTQTSSLTSPFTNAVPAVVSTVWGGGYSKVYKDGTLQTSNQLNNTISGSAHLVIGQEVIDGPWEPTDIVSCSLWLDADDASSITLSGSNVTQWSDKSGNGNHYGHATAANQPAYSASVINGRSVVTTYDSGDAQFLSCSSTTDYVDSSNHFTTFMVTQQYDETGGYGAALPFYFGGASLTSNGSQYIAYQLWEPGTVYSNTYMMNNASKDATISIDWLADWKGQTKIITGRQHSAGVELRLTGTLGNLNASGVNTVNGTGASLIGADLITQTSYRSNIHFAEIIQYNRGLTDAECATVETYLQNKWDITVATQSTNPVLNSDNTSTATPTTNAWSGSIGEMLVYNRAISDKERNRAENYLQQKWRVTGSS